MAKKAGKIKISKAKQKNILGGKKTKGKKTGSQSVVKARRKLVAIRKLKEKNRILRAHGKVPEHEEATAQDVLDMLDNEELSYIKGADHIRNQYLLPTENGSKRKERKRKITENDDLENKYESNYAKEMVQKKSVRVLLPIKTKGGGITMQTAFEEDMRSPKAVSAFENSASTLKQLENKSKNDTKDTKDESGKVISTAMLLARRKSKLAEYKMKIGILSASFLEDPDNRLRNLDSLLAMLQTNESAVSFTVPKLSAISLVMVFQDVLPAYAIKHHNAEGVKLKKDTRELQGGEANLLRRYRTFLQRLEKLVTQYLPRRKPGGFSSSEAEIKLGRLALECMCKMLISHPYFNLATNIINYTIPFLNHWDANARLIVSNSIKSVFRIDKRGEISYEIVRRINILVKSKLGGGKLGFIRRDVIDVLLALRIKEVDLEKEKVDEMTPKAKMTFEERRMLSKKSRKKAKDMVQLERELLETAAEENKSKKSHYLTEITKLVFTMYFRTLKTNPQGPMLSAVLEGLAKFAHIINVDFFDDLLKVLGELQRSGGLKRRQSILCIATVLAVLDGQGQALTLDPTLFHKNLYALLVQLRCGRPETDVGIALRCIRLACGKKKIPGPRAIAFVKRLATVTMQFEHNDALGSLLELKNILKMHPVTRGLLDSDGSLGSGVYLPELDNPDHCGAESTTLWELTTLMSHYHPWIPQVVRGMLMPDKVDALPKEIFLKHPEDIVSRYNPYETMNFQPELDPPTPTPPKNIKRHGEFLPRTILFREILPAQRVEENVYVRYLNSVNFVQTEA